MESQNPMKHRAGFGEYLAWTIAIGCLLLIIHLS